MLRGLGLRSGFPQEPPPSFAPWKEPRLGPVRPTGKGSACFHGCEAWTESSASMRLGGRGYGARMHLSPARLAASSEPNGPSPLMSQ